MNDAEVAVLAHGDGGWWIVVNIGCIECGVSSDIVGMFSSKERADEIAAECGQKFNWREGGQNIFEVFPVPMLDNINPEYDLTAEGANT